MIDITSYKKKIVDQKKHIIVPKKIKETELIQSFENGKAIKDILLPMFVKASPDSLVIDSKKLDEGIDEILENFQKEVLDLLQNEEEEFHLRHKSGNLLGQNLFEIANTANLYLSNKYTRVISENLGHKLEDIATLSHKIINPEFHFGFKIKGVDVILFKNNDFHFCQLKTKKDTLTGSQKSRSEKELEIHASSKFVACLSLGNWTFNTQISNIERIHGSDFWKEIDINYDCLIKKLSKALQKIEKKLFIKD